MRLLTAIYVAGLLLALCVPLRAQVPYDLSQAVEYKTVWRMELGAVASGLEYNKDFGGHQGLDIVTTAKGGKHQTWSTRPRLDTTNLFDWFGIHNAVHLNPIDYDGIPPNEYVNGKGIIWKCAEGASPFPLTPIDTAGYAECTGEPSMSADVDGDGYLDVITRGDGHAGRVIMGGPMSGKGCQRVFTIHGYKHVNGSNSVAAFFKSATGLWTMLQVERENGTYYSWLRLYRIGIVREADSLRATYTLVDSLKGIGRTIDDESFGNLEVVVDTVTKTDWLLLQHLLDLDTQITAIERFDITSGSFVSSGEKVTGITFVFRQNLGHLLGTTRPVIAMDCSEGYLLSYVDNLRQPFGRVANIDGFRSWAVINDQTGDGKPDILMSNWPRPNGAIRLVSGDPSVTSVSGGQPESLPPTANIVGQELHVTLDRPCLISTEVVTTDGRRFPGMPSADGTAGLNRFSLGQTFRMLPSGVYFLRVHIGETIVSLPYLYMGDR